MLFKKNFFSGNFFEKYGKYIVLVTLILFYFAFTQLSHLKKNPSPYMLDKSHPVRVSLQEMKNRYSGSKETIFVLLESQKGIFNRDTLKRIKKLTQAFEEANILIDKDRDDLRKIINTLPVNEKTRFADIEKGKIDWEIFELLREKLSDFNLLNKDIDKKLYRIETRAAPVIEVTSLANTDNILANDEGLEIERIYNSVPDSLEKLNQIKKNVLNNKILKCLLLTEDGKYSSIIIELSIKEDENKNLKMMVNRIENILSKEIPGPEKHYIAGYPAASAALGSTMQADTGKLFPMVLLIIVASLGIGFRSLKGVLIPVLVVVFSLVFTLAIKALLKIPLNIVTTTLPVFILSIGIADGIHIFSQYRDFIFQGRDKISAVKETISKLYLPVIMTSLTTAMAFIAISITEIPQLMYFGIFVAVGTIISMLLSLIFLPSLLAILPEFKFRRNKTSSNKLIESMIRNMSGFVINHPYKITAMFLIFIVPLVLGILKVKVDTNPIEYHKKDAPIYRATEKFNQASTGSLALNLLISTAKNEPQAFKNPKNLIPVADLVNFIEKQKNVGKVIGLTKLIEEINFLLHNNDPEFDSIPCKSGECKNGNKLISQYIFLYENGGGDLLPDYASPDYSELNLKLMLKSNSSVENSELIKKINKFMDSNYPGRFTIKYTGPASIAIATTKEIVHDLIVSLFVSFSLTLLLLLIMFRSLKKGLIATLPLVSSVLVNFSIMGYLNIPLDVGTVVISSIVIGIGVDFSIHYLTSFFNYLESEMDFYMAMKKTINHSGKAILLNALIVATGFSALLFSILRPLNTMGWMISISMIITAFCTLVIIPAFLKLIYFKKSEENKDQDETETAFLSEQAKGLVSILIIISVNFFPFFSKTSFAEEDYSARKIVELMDSRYDGETIKSEMLMVLSDAAGNKKFRYFESCSKDYPESTRRYMIVKSPADIKDTAYLSFDWNSFNKDDDSWLYIPSLRKTKRISSSNKSGSFMGSDFTYYDVNGIEVQDWTYKILDNNCLLEGKETWLIECLPDEERKEKVIDETGYVKIHLWIRKDNFFNVKSKFWVKKGHLVKYYKAKDLQQIKGIWTAKKLIMATTSRNRLIHTTIINFKKIEFNQKLEDSTFTIYKLENSNS